MIALLLVFVWAAQNAAREIEKEAASPESKNIDSKAKSEAPAPKEESSVTDHKIRIDGKSISYQATASTILLKDNKDLPTALIYSTAYTRNDVKDLSRRPIAFIYNGGPGSASIWLHIGAFGPKRVVTNDAAATPPAPYGIVENECTLLDKADLVFIDPVGTGFSRAVGDAEGKDFWGVDQDVKSLAQFINIYISRNNRWNSPKFLIGESYGTFRSVALTKYLQSNDGISINGMVLISSVLDMGTISFDPGNDRTYIFYLPTYAAAAWYYNIIEDRPDDLNAFLDDARQFASTKYAAALMKGSKLSTIFHKYSNV
jgi:carboxypeptidase C (cathepsin A)